MSIKKIELKSCKGNHKDSKKVVSMSRSISFKGRSETRGESEKDKDREPQNDGNQGTNQTTRPILTLHVSETRRNTHTTCVRDQMRHTREQRIKPHYMCQRQDEALKRSADQLPEGAFAQLRHK